MTVLEKEPRTIRLHPGDNVVVAVDSVPAGSRVQGILISTRIPRGHKIASAVIEKGAPVLKFGQVIGQAIARIEPGEWVHEHNVEMAEMRVHADPKRNGQTHGLPPPDQRAVFQGFRRPN